MDIAKPLSVRIAERIALANELFGAIDSGSLAAGRKAMALGADIEANNHVGHTPLMAAVERGEISFVAELLLGGARLDRLDVFKRSALEMAAAVAGGHRATPWVSVQTRRDIHAMLLNMERGELPALPIPPARPAVREISSPPDLSAQTEPEDFAPPILPVKPPVATPREPATFPKMFGVFGDHDRHAWSLAEKLRRQNALNDRLLCAIQGNHLARTRSALLDGARIDCKNNRGDTPLMLAIFAGSELSCFELLSQGASMEMLDAAKRSPLALAEKIAAEYAQGT